MIKEIERRRSVRKYIDKPVESEKIIQLIDSARIAPSGSNTQPWHFIIVKEESTKEKLSEKSHNQKWMLTAPVFIVCIADICPRIEEDINISVDEQSSYEALKQAIRDTSIAIEHIILEADNLALGTCWVAWFRQEEIRPILEIPKDKYVVGIITVGYANETPKPRPRKSFDEIVHYDKW
jgi:nitroreductase